MGALARASAGAWRDGRSRPRLRIPRHGAAGGVQRCPTSSLSFANWTLCDALPSVSLSRQRVAARCRRRSSISSCGISLLIAREWAILAGENDYTTDTFQQITGRPPRPVAEFLHEYRAEFV